MDFIVKISVDEDTIRSVTGDDETSIEGLVEQELGWVEQSGISYYSIEQISEDDEDEEELAWSDCINWSDCDDEEFLYTISQDVGLSKYDYESLMDDYRNLRASEWLDTLKDDLDEDTLAEFKRRFCNTDEEEEDE